MKDERITKELNKTKLIIIYYVFISSILITILKFLVFDVFYFFAYSIELYIIVMSIILFIIRASMYHQGSDERIEENYEIIGNRLFTMMFFGSFLIHFFMVAYHQSQDIIMYNITSTLILIGFIIFVYQLRKRKIYFHYSIIEKSKKDYLIVILIRILIFGLIFMINIIPYLLFEANFIIGLITILISILSLSLTYLLFSLYEKNHYDEAEMLVEGKSRNLSKNALLFYMLPFLYSITYSIINYIYNYYLMNENFNDKFMEFLLTKKMLDIFYIDIIILTLITYLIIRKSVKRLLGKGYLYRLLSILLYSTLVFNILNYVWRLINPIVINYVGRDGLEGVLRLTSITNYINLIFMLYIFMILSFIIYNLFKKRISHLIYLLIYAITPILATLINMLGFFINFQILLVFALILTISAKISIYIFFIKHTQIIKTIDVEPDYI